MKNNLKLFIVVAIMLFVVGTITYGSFYTYKSQDDPNTIATSCFSTEFTDSNSINLTDGDAYSMTDRQGLLSTPYHFELENSCDLPSKYYVILSTNNTNLPDTSIRFSYNGSEPAYLSDSLENDMFDYTGFDNSYIIDYGKLASGASVTYDIRAWIGSKTAYNSSMSWTGEIKVVSVVDTDIPASKRTLSMLRLTSKSGTPDFSLVATTDETADGLYAMADNYGTSYYFRGAVENNYVQFGEDSNGNDMYWRIIRINGDGSIRMIYDGTQAWGNDQYGSSRVVLTNISWNLNNFYDEKFVGYMYGGSNSNYSSSYIQADITANDYANSNNAVYNETDSNIKDQLDTWYKNNIIDTGYANYVSDEIFCNDRFKYDAGSNYAAGDAWYAAYHRNYTNNEPSLMCSQKNDAFTVGANNNVGQDDATGYGNGYLKYPVGLIIADEAVLAGSSMNSNNSSNIYYYLYKGVGYWTMSPYYFNANRAGISVIDSYGNVGIDVACNNIEGLAPVINIRPDVTVSGSGTMQSPYIFTLN